MVVSIHFTRQGQLYSTQLLPTDLTIKEYVNSVWCNMWHIHVLNASATFLKYN